MFFFCWFVCFKRGMAGQACNFSARKAEAGRPGGLTDQPAWPNQGAPGSSERLVCGVLANVTVARIDTACVHLHSQTFPELVFSSLVGSYFSYSSLVT